MQNLNCKNTGVFGSTLFALGDRNTQNIDCREIGDLSCGEGTSDNANSHDRDCTAQVPVVAVHLEVRILGIRIVTIFGNLAIGTARLEIEMNRT